MSEVYYQQQEKTEKESKCIYIQKFKPGNTAYSIEITLLLA